MVAAVFLPYFDPVSDLLFALLLRGHGTRGWGQMVPVDGHKRN